PAGGLERREHPAVCVMGQPGGRLIGSRPPAALDLERVFERAATLGVAMEINAQPDRMDLTDLNARLAKERGVRLVISTDAHATAQLDYIRYGVFAARRAGLTPDDVLNTLPYERFRKSIRKGGTPALVGAAAKSAAHGNGVAKNSAAAKRPAPGKPPQRARKAGAPAAKPTARAGKQRAGARKAKARRS